MKRYLLLLMVLLSCQFLFAQKRMELVVSNDLVNPIFSTLPLPYYEIPSTVDEITDFTTFAIRSSNQELTLAYRKISANESTSEWEVLNRNRHFQVTDKNWVSELMFLPNDCIGIELKLLNELEVNDKVELIFYQEFVEKTASFGANIFPIQKAACPCPQPEFLDRAAWCPIGDCTPHPNPSPTDVTHIIVHHAASTNASSNWSGVVRSIWDYHVNSNGWDDIGYNWLIDPEGNVYEGRGDNIRGAHFCGTNSNTLGICMLGDFQQVAPQAPAIEKLKAFLSWKTCDIDVDPEAIALHASSGIQLNRIAGHRQGCNTECPGGAFFPLFESLRADVNVFREEACDVFLAPTELVATFEDNKIALEWKDNSSNEMTFSLERAQWSNANYQLLTNLSENTNNYIDENVDFNSAYFYRIRAVNANDTTTYSNEVGIATVIASQNNLNELGLKIFPNPVSTFLNIESDKEPIQALHFLNINGQLLWNKKNINQNKYQFNVEGYETGIYLIHIITDQGILQHKILLQHAN